MAHHPPPSPNANGNVPCSRPEGAENRDSVSAGTAVSCPPSAAACRSTADASFASSFVAMSVPLPVDPLSFSPLYLPRALTVMSVPASSGGSGKEPG